MKITLLTNCTSQPPHIEKIELKFEEVPVPKVEIPLPQVKMAPLSPPRQPLKVMLPKMRQQSRYLSKPAARPSPYVPQLLILISLTLLGVATYRISGLLFAGRPIVFSEIVKPDFKPFAKPMPSKH